MFEYLGLVIICLMWICGAALLTKWRNKELVSISQHAASSKMTVILFASVVGVLGLALYVWMIWWLAPHIGLSQPFIILLVIAMITQMLTAAIPDMPGWRRKAHWAAAWSMAVAFLPLAWVVAVTPDVTWVKALCVVLATYMTAGWLLILLRLIGKRFLIFQTTYILSLQLIILSAAYLT